MRASILADRYAIALRDAIAEPSQLEEAAQALNALGAAYAAEPQLRYVLGNSALDKASRIKVLDTVMKAFNTPAPVVKLMNALIERNRMALLSVIAARFELHIDEWLNRAEVTAVTATPLTPELESRLVASLQKFSGKTIRMRNKVDPGIVGGLVIYMWGVFFDFSLRTRLGRLKQKLLSEDWLIYGD